MKVYFIGAGPGDPDLITIKALKILRQIDICLYAGSLINPAVLTYCRPDTEKYNSAPMNLDEISDIFKRAKWGNKNVARLQCGSLTIYSSICEQMDILNDLGIEYELVPGISSFQASAAVLKKELTLPEINQTVILTRMAGRTPVPEWQSIERLAGIQATMCIFLSVNMLTELVEKLLQYYQPSTSIAVVYKVSWPEQKIVTGTLSDIAEKVKNAEITKTAMIIVGDAINLKGKRSKLYDRNFTHEFR